MPRNMTFRREDGIAGRHKSAIGLSVGHRLSVKQAFERLAMGGRLFQKLTLGVRPYLHRPVEAL
jgi:hypothetical protein